MILASRSHRSAGLLAAAAIVLGTSGCFGGAEHEVTPSRPVIRSFTAAPSTVAPGGSSVLTWTVTGATSLSIAPGLGEVTGTSVSVRVTATTTYTLTATNAGGSSSTSVTVNVGAAPPAGLSYSQNPATYTAGVAIVPNVPTSIGGAITSYAVSPALPAGLVLNGTTGVISGTPAASAAMAVYAVTGSNATGSTTAGLTLTVVAPDLPTIVSFTAAPSSIAAGESSVLSWDVLGATLLSIDGGVGPVTGTSTTVTPAASATYTLSATNAAGTVTATVTVTVLGPPANLRYTTNPASYAVGVAISANAPLWDGGTPTSFTGSLPPGLALSATTGVVSGTPTTVASATPYTITASNASGSTTVILTITITPLTGLPIISSFAASPASIPAGGNSTLSWSVAGATSLAIDQGVGTVTGTSVVVTPAATTTYILSATNSVGTVTASTTVTVGAPPSNLVYASNPVTYLVGVPVDIPNLPTSDGGPIDRYEVIPPLPAGLVLDATSGAIGGTPTTEEMSALHTVTGSNAFGSTSTDLLLTVIAEPAPGFPVILWFLGTPGSIAQGATTVLTWDVASATSLSIDQGVGDVTALASVDVTPSVTTTYTLSAANGTGTTTLPFTVTVAVSPPTGLAYAQNPAVYTVGAPISPNQPSSGGGAITDYTVTPDLPAGLSLDPVTGVVSGTPLAVTPQATYTVTGSNSAGSTTVGLVLTVNPAVLAIVTQPANRSALPGSTATFSVVATGVQPLGYEWWRIGLPGPVQSGPLASYTTPVIQPADDGAAFYVVVTDAIGSVTSSEAVLTLRGFYGVAGTMNVRRYGHTATLLADGRVLIVGGNSGGASVASAEIYDPATMTFTPALNAMALSRQAHAAVQLPSGLVLIVGGCIASATACTSYLRTIELFDPIANAFVVPAPAATIATARAYFSAAPLLDGRVLVAGGYQNGSTITASAEIFDPVTGSFAPTASMATPRAYPSTSVLPDGSVLVAGGQAVVQNVLLPLASAERFVLADGAAPSLGTFEPSGSLASGRTNGVVAELDGGAVLIAGGSASGIGPSSPAPAALASTETFSGTAFASTGALNVARNWATSTRLPATGEVLVTGGTSLTSYFSSAEIFDPVSRVFTPAPPMAVLRAQHTATPLPDGTVLVVGGRDRPAGSPGFPLNSAELWAPYPGP